MSRLVDKHLWTGISTAYRLFSDTNQELTGDRAARLDWDLFLRIVCAAHECKPSERRALLQGMEPLGGRVEAVTRPWFPEDGALSQRTLARLDRAFRKWLERHPETLPWEALDHGLTVAIEERTIRVDAMMLSPATAKLVTDFLDPGPGDWLLCYGSAGGEVAGGFVKRLIEQGTLHDPVVRMVGSPRQLIRPDQTPGLAGSGGTIWLIAS